MLCSQDVWGSLPSKGQDTWRDLVINTGYNPQYCLRGNVVPHLTYTIHSTYFFLCSLGPHIRGLYPNMPPGCLIGPSVLDLLFYGCPDRLRSGCLVVRVSQIPALRGFVIRGVFDSTNF